MARLRYNGLTATLGAALTSAGTSVTFGAALTHSGGVAVPTITGSDYIPLTILDASGNVSEIVSLTAYTSGASTGTISRAQEGTTGVAHSSGDKVVHGPTALDVVGASYLFDVPPPTRHAKDDEFTGTTLDPKWTAPATSSQPLTLSVANGWVSFEPAASGSASTGSRGGWGIRQPAPAGSFTISAKVVDTRGGDDSRVGIFVASTTAGKGHILGNQIQNSRIVAVDGFPYSETADWGAYDGFDVYAGPGWIGAAWYRIAWDASSSTLSFYYSANGVAWALLTTRSAQAQPDRIGLAIWANGSDTKADHALACDWFRVTEP